MEKYLKKYTSQKSIGLNIIFIILSILGFFIGRVSVFHMLNPIAIGYLACLLLNGKIFNLALGFTFLGFFSKIDSFYITKYIICLSILLFINIIFSKSKNKNILFKSTLASLSIFISGLTICFINDFSTYYLVLTILETSLTFCMCFILNKGIEYIKKDNKSIITNEEIISIAILIGSIICGSSDVFLGNISFTYFFIITLLLFTCYIYGSSIGGIVALLSSFLLFLTNSLSSDLIIIFAISSILSSLIREKGKFFMALVFNICIYILILIINISLIDNILLYSILGSDILFLAIPCNIKANLSFNNNVKTESVATYTEKLQILTSNKLNTYANSFEKLSKTFYNLSDKKTNLDQQDISNLIDEVASKICNNCQMKVFCWEKNFYSTYQNIFSILNMYEKTGQIEKNTISPDFINNCININQFIDVLNKTFEIYKLNLSWKNKVIESRELVGKQLTGISSIIYDLSKNLCQEVSFKENYEAKIKYTLENNGIPTKNVIITENNKGKLEVLLKIEPCYIPNKCVKTIIPLINEILGKKMCKPCYECIITKENNESICSLSLVEEQLFRVSSYAVTAHKDGSSESGDSHSFLSLPNGTYLLALSDGMGSGKSAKMESIATIELLEEFLQAGFSKDLAINMINSVLFLKSSKDTFATLDMCTIDLYTGLCEILKIGAVSTLILHNNKVDIIKSNSLPVGILNNVEPEIRKKKLSNGDIIVMITDGVIDSTNAIINKEHWIVDILLENKSTSPEDIANTIFEKTKENYKNCIKDDITILVARIWN